MRGVAGVLPHPVRKGDVASEQLLGVAAAAEPFPLGPLTDIEQADRDVDQRSRRSGHQLSSPGATGSPASSRCLPVS
jgi:hypothetical protein